MIRILEVLATLKRAGAETVAVNIATGLDRTRFETAIVSLYDPFPKGFEPAVRVWYLGKRPGFDPRMYGRLREVVREFRPDVIHTHSYVMRYTLGLTARAKVHTIHNMADREVDRIGRLIHRLAFRRGVVPVAIAGEIARSFTGLYGFPPHVTIPNGIETERYYRPETRASWRARLGFSPDEVLIVSVARLDPQKNPLGLLEAFRCANIPARLLFAGDGSLRDELASAGASDLAGQPFGLRRPFRPPGPAAAHLLGLRTDLPELLSAADIFALASHWEGHPLSVMEAMAAGLPVVATAAGGVPEIVGDAGVLVAPGDTAAFSAALRTLVLDAGRRRALGAAARERAARFDVGAMVAAYARLFEELVRR